MQICGIDSAGSSLHIHSDGTVGLCVGVGTLEWLQLCQVSVDAVDVWELGYVYAKPPAKMRRR